VCVREVELTDSKGRADVWLRRVQTVRTSSTASRRLCEKKEVVLEGMKSSFQTTQQKERERKKRKRGNRASMHLCMYV
jgi:hypothetical protein